MRVTLPIPDAISFFVPGLPQPAGSKRAFYVKSIGRAVVTDANAKSKPWKAVVSAYGLEAAGGLAPTGESVKLTVVFTMPRPGYHFGKGKKNKGQLLPDAPILHTVKPDATKLLRGLEDALTGILWRDDSQIAEQHVYKRYGTTPGADVCVENIVSPRVEVEVAEARQA